MKLDPNQRENARDCAWGELVATAVRAGHPDPDLYADATIDEIDGQARTAVHWRRLTIDGWPWWRRLWWRATGR